MKSLFVRGLLAVGVVSVLCGAPPALAAGAHHGGLNHRIRYGQSGNWSGYVLTGSGPYQSVSASWTLPAVDCASTKTGWAAFWVGLDGDTTRTVEQTGAEADCVAGKPVYGAWYEMFPRAPVSFVETVKAGDNFTATVTFLRKALFGVFSEFQLTLSDSTQGWTRTATSWIIGAKRGSAEAIAEAPSDLLGVLPLADFGSVGFSGLTVNSSPVGASTPGLEPLTMVSELGTVEAEPGPLESGSFSDTWFSV
jgi:hypothetical protein